MNNRLKTHPILEIPQKDEITIYWNKEKLTAQRGEMISSALYANGITIFGHHHKDGTAQGIYCANGQCARCMVIANGLPVKSCMTPVCENMDIKSADGLPTLPITTISPSTPENQTPNTENRPIITDVLIIGGGPSGLSAAIEVKKYNIDFILIDDKNELGGKLVLQTHKFFGSVEDSYAGTRGIDIGKKLAEEVCQCPVEKSNALSTPEHRTSNTEHRVWLNSTALYVFKDKKVGILKDGEYILVAPKIILNAAGAREKFLRFTGNHLAGIYGAGAFQTLVNRDLIKSSNKLFIIGGGNVGLIAGYHALQAGIEVVGLVEAMPTCGGYKVHADKLKRLGVPIYTSHTILSANSDITPLCKGERGEDTQHSTLNNQHSLNSITIAEIDKDFQPIAGTEKTFPCDTILIAVGLESLYEFTQEAQTAGIRVYAAGDAAEIAEASSAMFNGKIMGLKIAKELGANAPEIPTEWYEKAEVLKSHPAKLLPYQENTPEEGIMPIIHCLQEIPCNPCTTVCPTNSIKIQPLIAPPVKAGRGERGREPNTEHQTPNTDNIMGQPQYDGTCIGCGKCLLICPGLAISLVDYRTDKENPTVSLPYEVFNHQIVAGDEIEVVDIDANPLGTFKVSAVVTNKLYKTQQIKIQMPKAIAKKAIGLKIRNAECETRNVAENSDIAPLCKGGRGGDTKHQQTICLCERITLDDVRKYIKQGITDINQIKALTRLGMGACGAKTCDVLIKQVLRQEGIPAEKITDNTRRPVFVEVPLEKFATQCPVSSSQCPEEKEQANEVRPSTPHSTLHTPRSYEVVIIGAGSIGVPTAMSLAQSGRKVLCIESLSSPGQANNKKAIGGVRATHSDFGKIKVCQRSIEIFSTWKETHGDDIGWISNGYSFPAYDDQTEKNLKDLLKIQQSFGLNISWLSTEEYQKLVPGINLCPTHDNTRHYSCPTHDNGVGGGRGGASYSELYLRGATYSPQDGSCSPLLACNAFYFKSLQYGAEYRFSENVIDIKYTDNLFHIKTDKGSYTAEYLINASGNNAAVISKMLGYDCPVTPDCHEAAITDPVSRFFGPMVVDIRAEAGSKNYYFYQNNEGQVVFCITPDPPIYGTDNDATSEFLPLCVSRMLKIYPALKNLKVRRQWRGQYPMTPDGFPIIGAMPTPPTTKEWGGGGGGKFIQAVGMCGQGFMLGPGVGELLTRIVDNTLTDDDLKILSHFDPSRAFTGMEAFK